MSLDGFIAGPNQTLEEPLGAGGERLHEWAIAARAWREAHGMEGGETNVDNEVVEDGLAGVGADVVQQYLEAGLLDEIQLHVVPLLLGDGVRLFDGPLPSAPRALECTRVIESPTGVTHLRYRPAS